MNNKGQFSIIAALLVAVVLIASVMTTYSAIRYSPVQGQPQIMSAVDQTNLALKQMLGFTVGYYGAVLQVTGNSSYAQTLAKNYFNSGLENAIDIRPEWGASFNITALSLSTYWFTNESHSEGGLNVTYDLPGLGISGVAYSVSCRLDVQISPSYSNNQVYLTITQDGNSPVVGLSRPNFKFYLYENNNMSWVMALSPVEPFSSSNGTYTVDIPPGINPHGFVIQVQDSRGITVAASSFSQYTGTLSFNSTFIENDHYVVSSNPVVGTHSNFTAQQSAPDSTFDTLTEANIGSQTQDCYPTGYSPLGSTTLVSGSLSNLAATDGVNMNFGSYDSSTYNTITYDSVSSAPLTSQASSMNWQHTTGNGNSRLLLVTVDIFNSGGSPRTISSITYGGVALTQSTTVQYTTNPQILSYLYYLVNPSSGSKAIAVSFSGLTTAIGGSITYTNVDQTNPLQATNSNKGSSQSQSTTLTASGPNSKILFGHMSSYRTTNDYSVTDQQTTRWSNTGGSYFKGYGSEKTVTSGSVSMTWSTSKTASWTAIEEIIQPSRVSTQQTCEVEFSGSSNTDNWNSLLYSINGLSSVAGVSTIFQLYNYQTGQYPTSGDGYLATTLGTTCTLNEQSITTNPTQFRDNLGAWKLKFKAVMPTTSSFVISIDMARYRTTQPIYALNLQEQWSNVNYTALRPTLCIKTGALGSENLAVDVWHAGIWNTVIPALASNNWNNVSISAYADSSTFTIRFRDANGGDSIQDNWAIDTALLRPQSDQSLFSSLQNPAATVAVELLQNGSMIWLGQNLQIATQAVPIPPIPVKAFHVNETIDGVNQQVPFQIEDWASSYTVPLGLTDNATVFGNRQMIVFLANTHVSDFTLWWNGSDQAIQTPLAFTNRYFSDGNPSASKTLNNGKMSIHFASSGFAITSTVGTISSVSNLMQINSKVDTTDPELSYVVYDGVVRDIVMGEPEFSNGITNCPNVYANVVLTLPANATYFTYQLRLMFLNSGPTRTISSLCPISVTPSTGILLSENGTLNGDPIVASGTQTFSNSTGAGVHHWSQFCDGTNGTGIMFTDQANQMLYTFDAMSPANLRGAIKADSVAQTISLLPVTLNSVSFQTALDATWYGAVATFDGSVPPIYGGSGQPGLWILAELPPTITIKIGT